MSDKIATFNVRMQQLIRSVTDLRELFEQQVFEAMMHSAVDYPMTYRELIPMLNAMYQLWIRVDDKLIDDSLNIVEGASEETIRLYKEECVAQQTRLTVRLECADRGYQDLVRKVTEARKMHEKLGTAQSRAAMIASREAARRAIMCDIFAPVRFASKQTIELYRAEIAACRV